MFKAVSDGVSRINIDAVVTCPSNLHDFLVFLEELKVTPARTANRHVFQITLRYAGLHNRRPALPSKFVSDKAVILIKQRRRLRPIQYGEHIPKITACEKFSMIGRHGMMPTRNQMNRRKKWAWYGLFRTKVFGSRAISTPIQPSVTAI